MVPGWLKLLGGLAPLLLIISVSVLVFGIFRLNKFISVKKEEREEEERKRREFLKSMSQKIANEKLKP